MTGKANGFEQAALTQVAAGLARLVERQELIAPDQTEVSMENLAWMCDEIIRKSDQLPSDKLNRWIGFVQGVLACRGFMSVAEERDRTREIFHRMYKLTGVAIPPTVERK